MSCSATAIISVFNSVGQVLYANLVNIYQRYIRRFRSQGFSLGRSDQKPAQFNFSEFLLWTDTLLYQSVTVEIETLWDLGVIRRHEESRTIEPIQYAGQDRGFVAILGLVELNIKSRVSSSSKISCSFPNEALTTEYPVPVKMFEGQSYHSRNTRILNSRG